MRSRRFGQYVAGEWHLEMSSRSWRPGIDERVGIVYAPGYGGSDLSLVATLQMTQTRDLFPFYPILAGSYAGATGFGNDTYITRVGQAVDFIDNNLKARSDKVAFFTGSGGTPGILNWAKDNVSRVACIVAGVPLVDIEDLHDNNRGGYADEVEAAYGGLAGYTAAMPTHNPAQYPEAFAGLPIRLYYSTDDPLIYPPTVTAFAAGAGSSCEAISMGATGHVMTTPGVDLLDFYEEHAWNA